MCGPGEMPTDAQNALSTIFHIEERDVLCVGPPLHRAYGCTSRLKLRLLIADRHKNALFAFQRLRVFLVGEFTSANAKTVKNANRAFWAYIEKIPVSALTRFSLKEKRRARSAGILRCRAIRSFSKSSYIGIPIFIPERSLDQLLQIQTLALLSLVTRHYILWSQYAAAAKNIVTTLFHAEILH